jgi:hypothetical protein
MVRFLRVSWLAFTAGAMLLTTAGAALAIQPTVVQIEKNTDGTYTYHFKIKIDDSVTDLAVVFFKSFAEENPARFPSVVTQTGADGSTQTTIAVVAEGGGYLSDVL